MRKETKNNKLRDCIAAGKIPIRFKYAVGKRTFKSHPDLRGQVLTNDKESTRGLELVGSTQLSIMTIMQVVRTESSSPLGSQLNFKY